MFNEGNFFRSSLIDEELEKLLVKNANSGTQPVYAINKQLGRNKIKYEYDDAFFILKPNNKIIFVNRNENDEDDDFLNYIDDVIADIDHLALKYDYRDLLGRPRAWREKYILDKKYSEVVNLLSDNVLFEELSDSRDRRNINVIISLLIGSINSADKVGKNVPENILEEVKRKIILFDSDQTRFIYEENQRDFISIQGLAGTGKTELLLHKLKELYLDDSDNKIIFTCYSKVLSNNLRKRIPEFFTFMKIDEQIDWENKLKVMPSWGSRNQPESGVYSRICSHYDITFQPYSQKTQFEKVCLDALKELEQLDDFVKCFDYILIDESQDFPKSFIDLCKKVTNKTVYAAGDIFQKITDAAPRKEEIEYLLNRCYRTDNKTLMFAHGLALGLFEPKKLQWFRDEDWEIFGYNIEVNDEKYKFTRLPISRFDTEQKNINDCMTIKKCNLINEEEKVMESIREIREKNPSVCPNDIAVVYISNSREIYTEIDSLEVKIQNEFSWETVKGYNSKKTEEGKIFLTNLYNIKGLEFPFVICVASSGIETSVSSRNALYMALTRSFLSSYLIINTEIIGSRKEQRELYQTLQTGLNNILTTGYLEVKKPNEEEVWNLDELMSFSDKNRKSQRELIEEILYSYNIVDDLEREGILSTYGAVIGNSMDENRIRKIIEFSLNLNTTDVK